MLLKYRRRHSCVFGVVVRDKVRIAQAGLLLDEDGRFHYLSESSGVGIACLEYHLCNRGTGITSIG